MSPAKFSSDVFEKNVIRSREFLRGLVQISNVETKNIASLPDPAFFNSCAVSNFFVYIPGRLYCIMRSVKHINSPLNLVLLFEYCYILIFILKMISFFNSISHNYTRMPFLTKTGFVTLTGRNFPRISTKYAVFS